MDLSNPPFELPKVIGIIPARFGSTRFPGKPLASIFGKTLIQRTYENACQCTALEKVIVATDDQRIFDHVISFGGLAVMTSSDLPTGTDRLAEAVEMSVQCAHDAIIVNIQGDEPCLDITIPTQIIQQLQQDPLAMMSTAIAPLNNHEEALSPHVVKCVIDGEGNALYFSRSLIPGNKSGQFSPSITYYKHIGIYAYRRSFLMKYSSLSPTPLQQIEDLEQLKVLEHGYRIKTAIIKEGSIGVDTPEDIKKVELELCKQNTFS
jgi:3-deoxy-manno-octulosonate cytidylyltransferase (CMP-KDO synthetase)